MAQTDPQPAVLAPAPAEAAPAIEPPEPTADGLVEDDLLVEDISIDGMCGVY